MTPEKRYARREHVYDKVRAKHQRLANRLSNDRLTSVLLGFAVSGFVFRAFSHGMGAALGLLTLILFGYLALTHRRVRSQLTYAEALRDINRRGMERVTGRWTSFTESGAEFKDDHHPYASDLDLFGQASLFQWINSAHTNLGQETLAEFLKKTPDAPAEIMARQEAISELARKLAWRQRFESEGMLLRDNLQPTAPLTRWAEAAHMEYLRPFVNLGIRILPAITIACIVLYAGFGIISWQVPTLLVIVHSLLLRVYGEERGRALSMVHRFEPSLRTYSRMLRLIETQKFRSPWLGVRQERLRDANRRSAGAQIHRLSAIAERISNRENAMFIILNILTLWDYHCMVALEAWKQESGPLLRIWLEVLAEIEALSSLANIRFEQPDWAVPIVADDTKTSGESVGFSALSMGHPLITRNRVPNDFELKAPSRIAVITGSNMSGKSTFLRTVGINLVLAYSGAPACARQFSCSLMSLWTSMRVSDNLEQNVSSFYAELLRIKRVVEAASTERRICFLLSDQELSLSRVLPGPGDQV